MEDTQVELTPEQIDAQAWAALDERKKSIEATLGKKVFAIMLRDLEDVNGRVTGFAYEPDLTAQVRLIDQSSECANGFSLEACSKALESLIIVSETDARIHEKKNLSYWKGACAFLSQFMGVAAPVFKKK